MADKIYNYFGSLQGPFTANEDLFGYITQQHSDIDYITKLGIIYNVNYDLDLQGKTEATSETNEQDISPILIKIGFGSNNSNNPSFQLGKTGILELQNVKINSIKFQQDVNDKMQIHYQYCKQPSNNNNENNNN